MTGRNGSGADRPCSLCHIVAHPEVFVFTKKEMMATLLYTLNE